MTAKKSVTRLTRVEERPIPWDTILQTARPLILLAINLLSQSQKLGKYSNLVRLLGTTTVHLLPPDTREPLIERIRETHQKLTALGGKNTAQRRKLLAALQRQLDQL
jgi:hypothetical protein